MVFLHGHQSNSVCPKRTSLLQFPILSFPQFVTITDIIDDYYYLFYGEQASHQRELAQIVEHLLSMQTVLGLTPRFSSHYRSRNSLFAMKQ